jgi:hypothetical protein
MMLWDLPLTGKAVKVDFWMSTGAMDAMNFLRKFVEPLNVLGNKLEYTPHFYIIETQLKLPGCLEAEISGTKRYFCDPLMSSDAVVHEDLRQLCLFRANKNDYWKYLTRWFDMCHFATSGDRAKLLDDKCSNDVLKELGIEAPEKDKAKCSPALLADQARDRAWSAHALQINGWRYSGPLDADAVTRTICAAFTDFPAECDAAIKDKIPTVDHGSKFLAALLWSSVIMLPVLAMGAWAYRKYVQKSLYRSLREEVMLEVRSQIQDYSLLSDPTVSKPPGSIQLKNFTRE